RYGFADGCYVQRCGLGNRFLFVVLCKSTVTFKENIVAFGYKESAPKVATFPYCIIIILNNGVNSITICLLAALTAKHLIQLNISEIRQVCFWLFLENFQLLLTGAQQHQTH